MFSLRNRSQLPLTEHLAIIKKSRELTPTVYRQLTTIILSNQSISAYHRQQIVLLLDEIKLGLILITHD